MRIPNHQHESGPWRIGEIAADIPLEDAWALPVVGGPDDFIRLVENLTDGSPSRSLTWPARLLWAARDLLGRVGLGRTSVPADAEPATAGLTIPGSEQTSVVERLPDDLRGTAAGVRVRGLPFTPVYLTDSEFVAELSNRTVHALMHLAWVDLGDGTFRGQMGVYALPRGVFGRAYMAGIKPLRLGIVYPALMRLIEQEWTARARSASTA